MTDGIPRGRHRYIDFIIFCNPFIIATTPSISPLSTLHLLSRLGTDHIAILPHSKQISNHQPKIAKTIRLIQLIYLLSLFILTMPKLPTLITGALPAPQQPNPLPLGHIYIRSQPSTSFSLPSPTFKSNDKPAFEVREVAYSVFYPSEPKWKGKKWVPWVIEPTKGVLEGYEKFIGKSGLGWMCEF
jgi:hypothetical protein